MFEHFGDAEPKVSNRECRLLAEEIVSAVTHIGKGFFRFSIRDSSAFEESG